MPDRPKVGVGVIIVKDCSTYLKKIRAPWTCVRGALYLKARASSARSPLVLFALLIPWGIQLTGVTHERRSPPRARPLHAIIDFPEVSRDCVAHRHL